jgi:hypothetical protein
LALKTIPRLHVVRQLAPCVGLVEAHDDLESSPRIASTVSHGRLR